MMKNWFGKNPESAESPSSRRERHDGPPLPLGGLDRAQLTRPALKALAAAHPQVAAKLTPLIAMNLSARLRDVTDKFKRHVVMSNLMRAEQYREAMPRVSSDADRRSRRAGSEAGGRHWFDSQIGFKPNTDGRKQLLI